MIEKALWSEHDVMFYSETFIDCPDLAWHHIMFWSWHDSCKVTKISLDCSLYVHLRHTQFILFQSDRIFPWHTSPNLDQIHVILEVIILRDKCYYIKTLFNTNIKKQYQQTTRLIQRLINFSHLLLIGWCYCGIAVNDHSCSWFLT